MTDSYVGLIFVNMLKMSSPCLLAFIAAVEVSDAPCNTALLKLMTLFRYEYVGGFFCVCFTEVLAG